MKLMKHLYQVGGVGRSHFYDASAYLLEGEDGLHMIDCGTPEGMEQILSNIRSLGFDPADIRDIYATHGHYDHIGAAALWKQKFGCRLYVEQEDVRQVEEGDPVKTTASLLYGSSFLPCRVDAVLRDGQRESFGFQISMEVLHTPGHTPGSVCFAMDMDGFSFLIAGDTFYGGFSPAIGSDEGRWKKSLDRVTARHFDGFTFGHMGPNVSCDADTRLAELKRQFGVYYNPWFKPMKEAFRY
ncbi:MAG: MBL fold metallo-hydrolase [Eubacteriales bacterium]|nr:MBL fold metallo-hydrolase [Eubacteriales bacterium]